MSEALRGRGDRPPTARRLARDVVGICLVGAVFIGLALVVDSRLLHSFVDIDHWRLIFGQGHRVGGRGMGMLAFVVIGGLLISAGVPRTWLSVFAGGVYGVVRGSILAVLAATVGAVLVYLAGRLFLQTVVDRRIGGRLEVWRDRFRRDAFWWVLYGRLFPFSNSTLNSLVCGSCAVPLLPYLAGSVLGFVPHSVIFAMFGDGGAEARISQVLLGVGLLLVTVILRHWWSHRFPASAGQEISVASQSRPTDAGASSPR